MQVLRQVLHLDNRRGGSVKSEKPEKLVKATDDTAVVRSKSGYTGVIREEVWVDETNRIAKYNLAYINSQLCQTDNGRTLGYDNAHGFHERHYMGKSEVVKFSTYEATAKTFYAEVQSLKERS